MTTVISPIRDTIVLATIQGNIADLNIRSVETIWIARTVNPVRYKTPDNFTKLRSGSSEKPADAIIARIKRPKYL